MLCKHNLFILNDENVLRPPKGQRRYFNSNVNNGLIVHETDIYYFRFKEHFYWKSRLISVEQISFHDTKIKRLTFHANRYEPITSHENTLHYPLYIFIIRTLVNEDKQVAKNNILILWLATVIFLFRKAIAKCSCPSRYFSIYVKNNSNGYSSRKSQLNIKAQTTVLNRAMT